MPYPKTDHCDGERFFSPGADTDRSFADMARWLATGQRARWPAEVLDPPLPFPDPATPADAIAVTFVGQSTFFARSGGVTILTDPIFSDRASPFGSFGPKRARKPGIAFDALPNVDVILLSHNHYDHMDLPTLGRLRERFDPTIVTGLGNGADLRRKGFANVVELDWWDTASPAPGLSVTFLPAQHWSRRSFHDNRRTLWGGHLAETRSGRLLFAGDSGYGPHFAAIRERCGTPDLALLPIGAYEPRWFMAAQHMNPDDAVRAHLDLGSALSVAMHFGTFQLTDEAIDAPGKALAAALAIHGVRPDEFRLPAFGETIWTSSRQPEP